MSAFDEVLAEQWRAEFDETGGYDCMTCATNVVGADGSVAKFDHGGAPRTYARNEKQQVRAAVAVLGKQALARIADLVEEREKNGLDDRAAAKMIDDIAFEMQKLRERP